MGYYKKSSEQIKNDNLKWAYGITLKEYMDMLESQEGRCKICSRHFLEFKKKLAVDHCHETGKIRGLLCMNCNQGLGRFKDSEENLLQAIQYLKDSKK